MGGGGGRGREGERECVCGGEGETFNLSLKNLGFQDMLVSAGGKSLLIRSSVAPKELITHRCSPKPSSAPCHHECDNESPRIHGKQNKSSNR